MRLEPSNIHELAAARMSDQAAYVGVAESAYVPHHIGSFDPGDEGLIGMLMHQHDSNVQAILDNIGAAQGVLHTVSDKLQTMFESYERTDDDQAVRFTTLLRNLGHDPQYQSGAPLGSAGSPARFPEGSPHLRVPVPMEGIPDPAMMLITMGGDLISPSFYLLGIVRAVIGHDPLEWLTRELVGDYENVSMVGDAVRVVGEFYDQLTDHLTVDAGILFDRWQGVAADEASAYYRELLDMFAQQPGPYSQLAGQYDDFAWACFFGAQALYDAVAMFVDYVIQTGIELVAGTAGLATGWGDIAIVAIFEAWKAVTAIHGAICAVLFAAIAAMVATRASLSSVSLAGFQDA